MPKLNGVHENILYLIALAANKFVESTAIFLKKCPHIEASEKAKPHPFFQKLPPEKKKKKPLSRRGNHALIAATSINLFFINHTYIIQTIY